jgi:poly(ADP-ribose) glycohydrolase ARH3
MAASASWRSRTRGSLLLAACADAIGSAFEGHRDLDPETVAAAVDLPQAPLQWTDDTAQMLVLAEHLAAQEGRIGMDALAAAFVAAWAAEPTRGYGSGAATMLAQIAAGAH